MEFFLFPVSPSWHFFFLMFRILGARATQTNLEKHLTTYPNRAETPMYKGFQAGYLFAKHLPNT